MRARLGRSRTLLVFLGVLVVALFAPRAAVAHGMRTAYVELREHAAGRVDVLVRAGTTYGSVRVVMPPECGAAGSATYVCARPLAGSTIAVEGLGGVVGEAVLVAIRVDGSSTSALVRANAPSWTIPERSRTWPTLVKYGRAGFVHVLSGADHLLFLAALVFAIRRFRGVVVAETAFTISHSVALSATTLGWLRVPAPVAEAGIALSLVLVALDLGRKKMTDAAGARTALVFGAVHGLGFAGGLEELGVPRDAIATALLGFGGGIEIAQVAFLLVCFVVVALARRIAQERRLASATAWCVGGAGFFWLFERAFALATP